MESKIEFISNPYDRKTILEALCKLYELDDINIGTFFLVLTSAVLEPSQKKDFLFWADDLPRYKVEKYRQLKKVEDFASIMKLTLNASPEIQDQVKEMLISKFRESLFALRNAQTPEAWPSLTFTFSLSEVQEKILKMFYLDATYLVFRFGLKSAKHSIWDAPRTAHISLGNLLGIPPEVVLNELKRDSLLLKKELLTKMCLFEISEKIQYYIHSLSSRIDTVHLTPPSV